MYFIAVCEDEPRAAEENKAAVCRILDGWGLLRGEDYDIDVYYAAGQLAERMEREPDAYQLLLLDIQLNGGSGVELAALLRKRQVKASIIYVTAHPGFALDSFPTYPLEYLLKPVDEARLAAALDWDWRRRFRPEQPVLQAGEETVPLSDILYLEISGRKTAAHTVKEVVTLSQSLSKLREPLLPQGFYPSHFSYLVNLAHVRRVERAALTLDTGETIPVSRRYYQNLMEHYINYLKT